MPFLVEASASECAEEVSYTTSVALVDFACSSAEEGPLTVVNRNYYSYGL